MERLIHHCSEKSDVLQFTHKVNVISLQGHSLSYDEWGGDSLPDGIHLRKLNQPFSWHDDDDTDAMGEAGGGGGGGEEGGGGNNSSDGKVYSTCRNSVQGRMLIADDKGMHIGSDFVV